MQIVDELSFHSWLDRHTRAVVLEFTLYNPNTNVFIYNTFLIEFPETGGAITSYSVSPLRIYQHNGPAGAYTLLCECLVLVYLILLLCKISLRIYQQGYQYFKKVWQVYELVQFLVGITAVVIYFFRLGFTKLTIDRFKTDKKIFVNFQHIAFWDHLLITFLDILVFMTTLRLLQVFETSKRVVAIVKIFRECGKDLFWFGFMFSYICIGFCILGRLLFGPNLVRYRNIFRAMGTLFISLLGKSNFTEISRVNTVLAALYFFAFVLTTVFFIMTIFLSILGGSIDAVMHDVRTDRAEDIMHVVVMHLRNTFWRPKKSKQQRHADKTKRPKTTIIKGELIVKRFSLRKK